MAYKNLHCFIATLEKEHELRRIKTEVDVELEITEIADKISKRFGPGLLFENVKGSKFPLLINAMGTYKRMNMALEVENLDAVGDQIGDFIDITTYMGLMNKFKALPKLSRLAAVFPLKVPKGSCQDVVNMGPDLNELPILKCWPQDGGKFITLPLVITKDPETGQQNTGMYRMQVFDKNTTGMHWHLHKDGREIYDKYKKIGGKMPVSVAIGCDPAVTYAATAPLPKMIDEMMFAGYLRKFPVSLVKSKTNDIYVPANAEFIIEGYVDVNEDLRLEGPFGDHTGYYSLADYYPAFHVTCITHKKNAVYPTTIVGKPPMEDCYLGKATERIFLPLIKMQYPEIIDYNFPLEGVFHNCVIISIKKRFPGHGRKIMNSLWGIGQMMYTKMIIVVDETINPHDISAVALKVFNNIDVNHDLVISEGPLDALDHASNLPHYGYRLGIDATKKMPSEGYRNTENDEGTSAKNTEKSVTRKEILEKFKITYPEIIDIHIPVENTTYQCAVVSIKKTLPKHAEEIMNSLWETREMAKAKIIIVVDENVNPHDLSTVSWKVFNNIDANRDLVINEVPPSANLQLEHRLGIDATKKWASEGHAREWPDDIEMSDDIKDLVSRRWNEYGLD